MACPTCDHTMQNVGAEGQRIFWCPRCGTLSNLSYTEDHRDDEVPSLWRNWSAVSVGVSFFNSICRITIGKP